MFTGVISTSMGQGQKKGCREKKRLLREEKKLKKEKSETKEVG